MQCPRLVIGATGSGLGKTSVTLALTAAFRRRRLCVQTFKAGPDFLDPTWLTQVSGRPCYNLDGWMCGRPYAESLFRRAVRGADIALIEGVMGLFDGADPAALDGSTAELARWLNAPVLLVVDAHGMARSVAAMVSGFARFEPGVTVAGVIANSCGSERHAAWIAESLRAADLPPLVGTLPRGALPSLPSRHLGLVAASSGVSFDEFANAVDRRLALDAILAVARGAASIAEPEPSAAVNEATVRLGLAEDAAFHFYYPDNLEVLEAAGAQLVRFSPLSDPALPPDLDGLYIGGGYPEEHAAALAANTGMRASVRDFAASGRPVYAECGGLMYLSQGIETLDGGRHAMAGVLPVWTRMLPRRKALGYVEMLPEEGSLFAGPGACLRGHEFHYSEIVDPGAEPEGWRPAYRLRRRCEASTATEGFQRGRILASYVHLHFASHPDAARRFVRRCEEPHL